MDKKFEIGEPGEAYITEKYTYADIEEMYEKNPEGNERYELIDGDIYLISKPAVKHQMITLEMATQLKLFFKGKKCKPITDVEVNLSGEKDLKKVKNVVVPDLMVVCEEEKIAKNNIMGVPSFAIEVLSPSNVMNDKFRKYHLYQRYGIKEYWIVNIEEKAIYAYILNKEKVYTLPHIYQFLEEDIPVSIFKGLTISLKEFWKENEKIMITE